MLLLSCLLLSLILESVEPLHPLGEQTFPGPIYSANTACIADTDSALKMNSECFGDRTLRFISEVISGSAGTQGLPLFLDPSGHNEDYVLKFGYMVKMVHGFNYP